MPRPLRWTLLCWLAVGCSDREETRDAPAGKDDGDEPLPVDVQPCPEDPDGELGGTRPEGCPRAALPDDGDDALWAADAPARLPDDGDALAWSCELDGSCETP